MRRWWVALALVAVYPGIGTTVAADHHPRSTNAAEGDRATH